MNDENKVLEWIPNVEEYNPDISKEKWLELISNRSVFDENALVTFACIKNANVATCSDMAEKFGRVKNFYNNNVWQTGKKVHLETNCQLSERDNEEDRYWSVCCLGRYLANGRFEYKIRPELEEAFEENGVLGNIANKCKFKCLLEYFVAHLEYVVNKKETHIGYGEYIKPLIEKNEFKEAGQGHKGHNIQNQIERWNEYDDNVICINVYASNPQSKATYLNWESSWNNIRPSFNKGAVKSLYITEEEHTNAKSELEYSVEELGLFTNSITDKFNKFYEKYMSYIKINQTMNNNNNKPQKYIDILEANKNLILTGAPGTGKTSLAKQIAAGIIYGNNVPKEFENDITFKTQCKLVQFHPSYDYTDFVEGLRPVEKDGNVGFERKDGVFKEFCKKAIEEIKSVSVNESEVRNNSTLPLDSVSNSVSEDEFEWRYNRLLNDIKSKKYGYEAYSTDRAYYPVSIENDDIRFKQPSGKFKKAQKDYVKMIFCDNEFQGKTSSDIEKMKRDKIENIFKENNKRNYTESLDYTLYRWVLMKIAEYKIEKKNNIDVSESSNSPTKFVFIIDEINRGEVSKIFGELFYSIDPGYRGEKGRVLTQYQNLVPEGDVFKNGFYVPENVYIIGTMNDIDRSVESMDFAFRRRFAFMEVKADENLEMLYEELDENLADKSKNRLINLNKKISEMEDDGLSSAYHIGASYFLKIKDYNGDFEKLWNYHLDGLLREYLRGMPNIEAKIKSLKVAYDNESASNN